MLVVLGHTNDSKGRLSKVAMSRCALLYEFWKENEEEYILATGTFGVNFNITDKPHYEYLYEYLVELGIPKSNLLDGVMSTNTYEDIIGIRKRIIDREENRVCIVTSDFHQERTSFICGRILQNINFKVAAAKTDSSKLDFYMSKERKSIEVSRQEIFFFPIYLKPNDEFPVSIYQNANQEHKHYDNLSIVSISGQLVVYGFGIKHIYDLMQNGSNAIFEVVSTSVVVVLISFLLWKLYHRTAKTARVARQLMRSIELSYENFGFSALFRKQNFFSEYFGTVRIVNWLFFIQITSVVLLVFQFVLKQYYI